MTNESGKRNEFVKSLLMTALFLCLIAAAMTPLTRGQILMQFSLALQNLARRTGQTAIKLEIAAHEQVNA